MIAGKTALLGLMRRYMVPLMDDTIAAGTAQADVLHAGTRRAPETGVRQRDARPPREESAACLKASPETLTRFERVESLIDSFETASGMELLGTVHRLATHESRPAATPDEAITLMHHWSPRKRHALAAEHIRAAWNRLVEQGWIRRLTAAK